MFNLKEKYLAKIKAERFKVSDDDVMKNICTKDQQIIDTLYDLNLSLLDKVDVQFSSLDSKGSNILGMAGVALALIFSLGGLLIEKIDNRPLFFTNKPVEILSVLYMITVFLLLASVIFAFLAVKARTDINTVSDEDIFTKEIGTHNDNSYKRYLIVHYWQIYKNNYLINELKGLWLKWAYWSFAASMIFLLLISVVIGIYSLNKAHIYQEDCKTILKEDKKSRVEKIAEKDAQPPTTKSSTGTKKPVVQKIEPTAKSSNGK